MGYACLSKHEKVLLGCYGVGFWVVRIHVKNPKQLTKVETLGFMRHLTINLPQNLVVGFGEPHNSL